MARNKDKVSPAVVEEPKKRAPRKPREVASTAPEAPQSGVEEVICEPNMDIVNRALAEAAARGDSSPPVEQRQELVANLVGSAVDINAVIAKHLAVSAPTSAGSDKVPVSRSSVVRPVKLVHCIASEMYEQNPELKRKDVIAACEAAGIATHTARTQYQIWAQAMRNDHAPKPVVPAPTPTAKRR
jgi:hypothetical protein